MSSYISNWNKPFQFSKIKDLSQRDIQIIVDQVSESENYFVKVDFSNGKSKKLYVKGVHWSSWNLQSC